MPKDPVKTKPAGEPSPNYPGEENLARAYESLKLHGLIRNGSALAVLVLTYSMDWMNLVDAGSDLGEVRAAGVSMSASVGGRESLVVDPGDMNVFGIPLTMAFIGLFASLVLRVAYPKKRRLHPVFPLALAATGTVMLGTVLGYALHDETARFFTSGFYLALAAFVLNTLFDGVELFDWRDLKRSEPGPLEG